MEAPQKACRTPYSARMVRYWHTLIHTQARLFRPIAAGNTAKTACPLHTPRRRIYIAELCTLLRLRLLLAAGGLADRVEARALCTLACISCVVSLVASSSTCTSESFAQAKSTRGKEKKGPRMELRESPGFGISSPAARSCHPTCAKPPSLHNSPTNHRPLCRHAQSRHTPFQSRPPVLCKTRMTHLVDK